MHWSSVYMHVTCSRVSYTALYLFFLSVQTALLYILTPIYSITILLWSLQTTLYLPPVCPDCPVSSSYQSRLPNILLLSVINQLPYIYSLHICQECPVFSFHLSRLPYIYFPSIFPDCPLSPTFLFRLPCILLLSVENALYYPPVCPECPVFSSCLSRIPCILL